MIEIYTPYSQFSHEEDVHTIHLRNEFNIWRVAQGLPPLLWHSPTAEVAYEHSLDMVNRGYFSHYSPEGLAPWDRLRLAGIRAYCGENICRGSYKAPDALNAWIKSPSHLANLSDTRWSHMGIGRVGIYWTMMFIGGLIE